jgi:hypothetical protein
MPTEHVYIVEPSVEETRPQIDFDIPENRLDWLWIRKIMIGEHPKDEYRPVRLVIHDSEAEKWDFYRCGGLSLLSKRATNVFGPCSNRCFEFLDGYINDLPYFFLRAIGSIDCLLRERSIYRVFPHDPDRIMWIEKYAFNKSLIPESTCLFLIPEGRFHILGTDSVEQLIRANDLHGIRLVDAEANIS